MPAKTRFTLSVIISGFFLLTDQWLKHIARTHPDLTFTFGVPWLGWEFLANRGIAFSLPFPNLLLVFFTPFIILGLLLYLVQQKRRGSWRTVALFFIIAGAISNLIDRVVFGVTIDYVRIFTSVINIADIMIVGGALLLVICEIKRKRNLSPSRRS